jgi:hypothetical protein
MPGGIRAPVITPSVAAIDAATRIEITCDSPDARIFFTVRAPALGLCRALAPSPSPPVFTRGLRVHACMHACMRACVRAGLQIDGTKPEPYGGGVGAGARTTLHYEQPFVLVPGRRTVRAVAVSSVSAAAAPSPLVTRHYDVTPVAPALGGSLGPGLAGGSLGGARATRRDAAARTPHPPHPPLTMQQHTALFSASLPLPPHAYPPSRCRVCAGPVGPADAACGSCGSLLARSREAWAPAGTAGYAGTLAPPDRGLGASGGGAFERAVSATWQPAAARQAAAAASQAAADAQAEATAPPPPPEPPATAPSNLPENHYRVRAPASCRDRLARLFTRAVSGRSVPFAPPP